MRLANLSIIAFFMPHAYKAVVPVSAYSLSQAGIASSPFMQGNPLFPRPRFSKTISFNSVKYPSFFGWLLSGLIVTIHFSHSLLA